MVEKYQLDSEGENWNQKEKVCSPGRATKKATVLRVKMKPSQLQSVESILETPQKVKKDC